MPPYNDTPRIRNDPHLMRWSGNAMVGRNKKALRKSEIEFAPSIDQVSFYDAPRERSSSPELARFVTNSGNKSHPAARFARRGKINSWAPTYEEVRDEAHVRKRMKICMEEFMPISASDTGLPLPGDVAAQQEARAEKEREKEEFDRYLLPHLRSPSPPLTTDQLAPMLAIPQSYVDIMMSPSMRHTLGDDSMEQGLQRTASDLLESEKPLLQSLGRLQDIFRLLERDVPEIPISDAADTSTSSNQPRFKHRIADLPHVSDTDNLWRVTQELLQNTYPPSIEYSITNPLNLVNMPSKQEVAALNLTPLERLFVHPNGITITAAPPASHPYLQLEKTHAAYPPTIRYNIDIGKQVSAVDDALERIQELLADCNEYKTRLEEARDRIADVARARKKVWSVIKDRAGAELDRYEGRLGEIAGGQLL